MDIPPLLKFILMPVVVWTVGQTIKFFLHILLTSRDARRDFFWIYTWAGGFPSTHTAIFVSTTYIIGQIDRWGPLFGLSFAVTLLLVYDLVAEKKKQVLWESYFIQKEASEIKTLIEEGKVLDISGHEIKDVIGGMILGIIMGMLLYSVFF